MAASHTILVIEDEDMIRDSLVEFLEDSGYAAVGATDGESALAFLKSARPTPSLILLDLLMPVLDGKEFRERQLSDPALASIPVIVLTAYRDAAKNARELQVGDYLSKPLRLPALLDLVQRHCPQPQGA